jgi:mRNA interferase YafQ
MRTIERPVTFRRDYKREAKGQYRAVIDTELPAILIALANDRPLDAKYRDHALGGNWSGHRECHIKPDLLLIYRKLGDDILELVHLGSHSELFG